MRNGARVRGVRALVLFVLLLAGGQAALANNVKPSGVTFGDKPSFQTGDNFEYALSPDKLAFTVTFTGQEISLDPVQVPARAARRGRAAPAPGPIATRTFSMVIPVTSTGPLKTAFYATGFVVTNPGSNAAILFSINGNGKLVRFPAGEVREFIVEIKHRAKSASDIRLTAVLFAERDSQHPGTGAFISLNAIDSDIALARKKTAEKAKK